MVLVKTFDSNLDGKKTSKWLLDHIKPHQSHKAQITKLNLDFELINGKKNNNAQNI